MENCVRNDLILYNRLIMLDKKRSINRVLSESIFRSNHEVGEVGLRY